MSKGTVNKVIIIGRLGADPDMRYMPNGNAIANIRVATDEQWKDRSTGQTQEHTEWHRIAIFGKMGEVAGQYLRKGSKVYIEGRIRTKKWQDQQTGTDRYSTEIVADQMQLLDSKSSGGNSDFVSTSAAAPTTKFAPQSRNASRSQVGDSFEPESERDYEYQTRSAATPSHTEPHYQGSTSHSQAIDDGLNDDIPF